MLHVILCHIHIRAGMSGLWSLIRQHPDRAGKAGAVVDAVPLCFVGGIRGVHDRRHKGLRIQVIEREPGALDLHHDAVAGQEGMVHMGQGDPVFQGRDPARRAPGARNPPGTVPGRYPR